MKVFLIIAVVFAIPFCVGMGKTPSTTALSSEVEEQGIVFIDAGIAHLIEQVQSLIAPDLYQRFSDHIRKLCKGLNDAQEVRRSLEAKLDALRALLNVESLAIAHAQQQETKLQEILLEKGIYVQMINGEAQDKIDKLREFEVKINAIKGRIQELEQKMVSFNVQYSTYTEQLSTILAHLKTITHISK